MAAGKKERQRKWLEENYLCLFCSPAAKVFFSCFFNPQSTSLWPMNNGGERKSGRWLRWVLQRIFLFSFFFQSTDNHFFYQWMIRRGKDWETRIYFSLFYLSSRTKLLDRPMWKGCKRKGKNCRCIDPKTLRTCISTVHWPRSWNSTRPLQVGCVCIGAGFSPTPFVGTLVGFLLEIFLHSMKECLVRF